MLSESFVVRPVELSDFAQWKPLWDGYNAFYERKDETALPDSITNVTWARFFDGCEPMHALVAEEANQLLGLAHFLFHRSTIALGPDCYLRDLFTLESARGRGIGRALIEEVYGYAKRAGATRLYWSTHKTNATAMRLYDQVAEESGFLQYRKAL